MESLKSSLIYNAAQKFLYSLKVNGKNNHTNNHQKNEKQTKEKCNLATLSLLKQGHQVFGLGKLKRLAKAMKAAALAVSLHSIP